MAVGNCNAKEIAFLSKQDFLEKDKKSGHAQLAWPECDSMFWTI